MAATGRVTIVVGDAVSQRDVAKAMAGQDVVVSALGTGRSPNLDWTLVCPTALTNDPAKGSYRVDDRLKMKFPPRISRADVAAFMHHAAHSSEWIRRDAVIIG